MPSKAYSTLLRGRDTFRLTFFNIFSLFLGNKAQDLQNQISNEGAHKIFTISLMYTIESAWHNL